MKKQREDDLVEYLLNRPLEFPRGTAGRKPKPYKWVKTAILERNGKPDFISSAIYEGWYGGGLNYDICDELISAFQNPDKVGKKESQLALMMRIQTAFDAGEGDVFQMIADHIRAVMSAPADPVLVAVGIAFFRLKLNRTSKTPLKIQRWVEEAEKMFEEPKLMEGLNSLRSSLHRKVRELLKKLP